MLGELEDVFDPDKKEDIIRTEEISLETQIRDVIILLAQRLEGCECDTGYNPGESECISTAQSTSNPTISRTPKPPSSPLPSSTPKATPVPRPTGLPDPTPPVLDAAPSFRGFIVESLSWCQKMARWDFRITLKACIKNQVKEWFTARKKHLKKAAAAGRSAA